MRILVTGADGFIGQHLVRELSAHGHEVLGADRDDVDLRQAGAADWLLAAMEPEVVVHLAAKVGRLFGEQDVSETILDNAGMTALVAKACGDRGVRLAYASTSEVYGDMGLVTAVEADGFAGLPHNAYGLSKRWGEEACHLYAPTPLILRLSMPYGPGHPPGIGRAALTNILHQALHGKRIPIHSGSERAWCWVGDTVRAIRLLVEGGYVGAFNVGRDDNALPMLEVARRACEMVGASDELIDLVEPPRMQTVVKRLSTAKLRMATGWEPEVELGEGMRRVLAYVRGFPAEHGGAL